MMRFISVTILYFPVVGFWSRRIGDATFVIIFYFLDRLSQQPVRRVPFSGSSHVSIPPVAMKVKRSPHKERVIMKKCFRSSLKE